MTPLDNFLNTHNLTDKTLILYSCYYDSEKFLNRVNSNFYYITGLNIPNLLIVYTKNRPNFIYKNTNIWDDNHSILKPLYDLYGKNTVICYPDNLPILLEEFPKKILTLDNFAQLGFFISYLTLQ